MVRNVHTDAQTRVIVPPAQFSEGVISALEHQVMQAILEKPESVAIDMAGVQAIDSAALNWLLVVQQRMGTQGIKLVLYAPSPLCDSVLIATRLDQRFSIVYPEQITPEIRHA